MNKTVSLLGYVNNTINFPMINLFQKYCLHFKYAKFAFKKVKFLYEILESTGLGKN